MRRGFALAIIVVALLVAVVLGAGRQRAWDALFGPPDTGRVEWADIERRFLGNDVLVCPVALCAAKSDIPAVHYNVSPGSLVEALDRGLERLAALKRVDDGSDEFYRRYVTRAPYTRAGDLIDVEVFADGDGGSTYASYARSRPVWPGFGNNLRWTIGVIVRFEGLPHDHNIVPLSQGAMRPSPADQP